MKSKFLKGFTLIEVLVVVVLMGILAAIAVPKLFGSVAKAKSSEIPPAASTYKKLQEAYVMGHGMVGNWKSIGYEAPGSNGKSAYFQYNEGELTSASIKLDQLGEEGKVGWEASNYVALNECTANNLWNITVIPGSSGHVDFVAQVSSDACIALASSFSQGDIASKGNNGSVGNTGESGSSGVAIGTNLMANAAATLKVGVWHENVNSDGSPVHKETGTHGGSWDVSHYSTYNTANTEGKFAGLYELEPNSEYTFTITVDEKDWEDPKNPYLKTFTRVYTEDNMGTAAIDMESYPDEEKGNGSGKGYNTSKVGNKNGYTGESTITKKDGKITTTVTINTGDSKSYFGASFMSQNVGWAGFATDEKLSTRRQSVTNAIQNATLVKTGSTEKEEENSSK